MALMFNSESTRTILVSIIAYTLALTMVWLIVKLVRWLRSQWHAFKIMQADVIRLTNQVRELNAGKNHSRMMKPYRHRDSSLPPSPPTLPPEPPDRRETMVAPANQTYFVKDEDFLPPGR